MDVVVIKDHSVQKVQLQLECKEEYGLYRLLNKKQDLQKYECKRLVV